MTAKSSAGKQMQNKRLFTAVGTALAVMACWFVNSAQPKYAKAESDAKGSFVVFFSSDDRYRDLAVGLSLYLTDKIRQYPGAPVRPVASIYDAAVKGNLLKTDSKKILVNDIPGLALDAKARLVVLGDLTVDKGNFQLVLNVNDGVSGDNIKNAAISSAGDLAGLIGAAIKKLSDITKSDFASEEPSKEQFKATLSGLIALGKSFSLLKDEEDFSGSMSMLRRAKGAGLDYSGSAIESEFIPFIEKKSESSARIWKAEFQESAIGKVQTFDLLSGDKLKDFNFLITRAEAEHADGKYDGALKTVELALKLRPSDAKANSLKAKIALAAGRKDVAYKAAQKAIDAGSSDPDLYVIMGDAARQKGKLSEAARLYNAAGKLFTKMGEMDKANDAFVKAMELDPKQVEIGEMAISGMSEEQRKKMMAIMQGFQAKKPEDPSYLRAMGEFKLGEGNVAEAEQYAQNAFKLNKEDAETNKLLGKIYYENKNDLDQAMKHFKQAKVSSPLDAKSTLKLAEINEKAQLNESAFNYYEEYLKVNPNDKKVLKHLAQMYSSAGNNSKAIKLYEKILALDPDDLDANKALADLYVNIGNSSDGEKIKSKLKKLSFGDKITDKTVVGGEDKTDAPKPEAKKETKPAVPSMPTIKGTEIFFPEVFNVVKAFEGDFNSIALIDYQKLKEMKEGGPSFFRIKIRDTSVLAEQLCKALATKFVTKCGDAVHEKALDLLNNFEPYKTKYDEAAYQSFSGLAKSLKVDAVAAFAMSSGGVGNSGATNFEVMIYVFKKGDDGLVTLKIEINENLDKLERLNVQIIMIPLIIAALGGFFILLIFAIGFGRVQVRVIYDTRFEQGYFGVKMSKWKLSQAFDTTKAMVKKFDGSQHIDTAEIVQKIFASWNPLVKIVSQNKAEFTKVPTGSYYLYLTGIMVNIDNGQPIGTYEIERKIKVSRNKTEDVEINLQVNEAFVEVRVKSRDQLIFGATVVVDDKEAEKKVTKEGEETTFYLEKGQHVLKAYYQGMGAEEYVEIKDGTPLLIDLVLHSSQTGVFSIPKKSQTNIDDILADGAKAHTIISSDGSSAKFKPEDLIAKPSDTEMFEKADTEINVKSKQPQNDKHIVGGAKIDFDFSDSQLGESAFKVSSMNASPPKGAGPLNEDALNDLFADINAAKPPAIEEEHKYRSDDPKKDTYIKDAQRLMQARKFDEAAECFLRAGEYDSAIAACQMTGNQPLTYKIYGLSYMDNGNYREAVEMFKYAGEILLQADAMERLRMHDEANKLRGEFYSEQGNVEKAVFYFQKANSWDKVGKIMEEKGSYKDAADAYFKARLYIKAADCYLASGEKERAAECYDLEGHFIKAADLYRDLGANVQVFKMLEKAGEFLKAAEGYVKYEMYDKAVQVAQQIPSTSQDYVKGVQLLVEIFREKKDEDMLFSTFERCADEIDVQPKFIKEAYDLAIAAQDCGALTSSLKLFEKIQKAHYNYSDVSDRLKTLKTQISESLPNKSGFFDADGAPLGGGSLLGSSGRYQVIEELGRGAMGVVFKAKDTLLERIVAFKTLSSSLKNHPAAVQYFLTEAKSLAALNHANIVGVYDIGQEEGNYYIVMEFIEGMNLSDFITEKGRLSLKNTIIISSKIASGLQYAHERRVVHRDIKPSNIMISAQGEVKIMDFGLAKIIDDAMQDKTVARGTPLYMSPEQIRGEAIDNRADIYSFGITMFEMVCGAPPFTTGEIMYHHLHTQPPKPSSFNPSIPEQLDRVILKCIEKERDSRYQNAEEIRLDLKPLATLIK